MANALTKYTPLVHIRRVYNLQFEQRMFGAMQKLLVSPLLLEILRPNDFHSNAEQDARNMAHGTVIVQCPIKYLVAIGGFIANSVRPNIAHLNITNCYYLYVGFLSSSASWTTSRRTLCGTSATAIVAPATIRTSH